MNGEKAWRQLHKNAACNIEQVLETAPHKAAAVRPPTTYYEPVMRDTAGEVGAMYACGPLHRDVQRPEDQLEPALCRYGI